MIKIIKGERWNMNNGNINSWKIFFLKKINWNLKMKMTVYAIFILSLTALLQLVVNHTFISDHRLIEAFSAGNVENTEGTLSCYVSYKETYLSKEDKKQLLIYLADGIGLHTEDIVWKQKKEDGKQILKTEKKAQDGDIVLSFISVGEKNEKQQYYIQIELILYDKLDSLLIYKKRLCNCLKKMNVNEYQPLISFSGEYNGKLSEQERSRKAEEILSILKAEVMSESHSDYTKNIYGYTEFLEEYLVVNQKRVNVNLVMAYDEKRDKTKLYLAAPVYNQDY